MAFAGPPILWIVAGANGVGKTTYAFRHIRAVSGSTAFVNLDEIARGLSPLEPEREVPRAARVALGMIADRLSRRNGEVSAFTIETTLAGRTHLRTIAEAQASGWRVHLLYFAMRDVGTALGRIARRVSEGGHAVPEADARRRFHRSLANFPLYASGSDLWRVFDNNGAPRVVAEGRQGCIDLRGDLAGLPAPLVAALDRFPDCEA